ncbi:unnamed protein product [Rhizoctonia solani]|uniref:Uncharacterized protein n=1 Tax=Rhizoctonia solani TaxID=456999 RepID=A0A8H3CRE9_9AGAM|nr:unnamed protein product [Rhizoctonia solani]
MIKDDTVIHDKIPPPLDTRIPYKFDNLMSSVKSLRNSVNALLRYSQRNVRRALFSHAMLLYAILDLLGLMATVWWAIGVDSIIGENRIGWLGLACLCARWGLGLFNEIFLIFHGQLFSNTIPATFFFQQCIYFPLVTFTTVIALWRTLGIGNPSLCIIVILRGVLDHAVWIALSYCMFQSRRLENQPPVYWTVQVGELTEGACSDSYEGISWTGIRRRTRDTPYVRTVKAVKHFIWKSAKNALFRRVRQVETKFQVAWMHMFALTAIMLILIRTVILLVQLANEDLPSRTLIQPCELSAKANETLIYVRHPQHQEDPTEISRGWGTQNNYNISFIYQQVEYAGVNRTTYHTG